MAALRGTKTQPMSTINAVPKSNRTSRGGGAGIYNNVDGDFPVAIRSSGGPVAALRRIAMEPANTISGSFILYHKNVRSLSNDNRIDELMIEVSDLE